MILIQSILPKWLIFYNLFTNTIMKCFCTLKQGCQFRSVPSRMAETFHTNSKNRTKRNKYNLILNLGSFRMFRLNSARNVPVSFHMFRSVLEKPLNQIESCSISLIKPPNYKKLFFITIFNNNDINNNIKNYYYYFH